ncbi:ribosome biosynthesis protein NOC4 KNAG_0A07910 [Huiozyma naganishii CBS 8797]|uniref:CCAAT-binding factor domain-containing protein n=1 Tax=Huiozyma naganishii (strain ATCC MYA-139 / BCRC 22969 / CBS 8797 / KCTC 17520 / NBRC 10181 / NCYC 3082 / Yp74L-3) TaxID=1071383 RepID=J7RFX4_HUIN7|nr:hypothetical protein KNAG_0A07910 [Kazachstania naganishii CBS 8797]CCK68443.1 hypothetical protein KNAG_0A07910 [Kazachstania naganishii CBS 8797]
MSGLTIDEVKSIAKKVIDVKEKTHYNSVVKLLNELKTVSHETQRELADDDEVEKKYRFLVVSLFQIFKKMFARNDLSLSAHLKSNSDLLKFNQWCRKLYDSFKTQLLKILSDFTLETSLALDSLDLYVQLLELESTYFATSKDAPFFANKTLKKLIIALWSSKMDDTSLDIDRVTGQSQNFLLLEFVEKYYKPYVDIQYYFQTELNQLLSSDEAELDLTSENCTAKWLALVNHDNHCSNEDADLEMFVSNPPKAVENDTKFKSLMEKNWLFYLGGNMSSTQYKTVLLILHKRIIPHFHTPTRLMDFLTDSYSIIDATAGVIPILALNGLFELIKKYNLEYPNFYQKLYQLLTPDLMHVKYRARFFRLMDVFLSSTHVSVNLIASFIKKLARLSLTAPPAAIVSIIPFIYNLLKKHPNCMIMIHNPKFISNAFHTVEEQQLQRTLKAQYQDPFNVDEPNPELTNAFGSSLWELATLMNHYHPNVASLAKIFGQPFRKLNYNMEDFLDWSYDSLLAAESNRNLKVLPTLEFETFDSVFNETEGKNAYLQNITW